MAHSSLQLPDYLRHNQNAINIMNLARRRRVEQTTKKYVTEHRIRLCKEHLCALREELLDADKDLQEVERNIVILHDLFWRTPAPGREESINNDTPRSADDHNSTSSESDSEESG
jgi:hypothetical protein